MKRYLFIACAAAVGSVAGLGSVVGLAYLAGFRRSKR